MSIAKKPTVPQFSSRVTPEKGVHPTRLPEETRILRGAMGLHNNEVSGIIEPIVEKMSGDNEKKFKGLFRRLKDSPDYKRSETVVRLLLQLLGGNGRLNKRLRKKRDEEERLLFAGLVHPIGSAYPKSPTSWIAGNSEHRANACCTGRLNMSRPAIGNRHSFFSR